MPNVSSVGDKRDGTVKDLCNGLGFGCGVIAAALLGVVGGCGNREKAGDLLGAGDVARLDDGAGFNCS